MPVVGWHPVNFALNVPCSTGHATNLVHTLLLHQHFTCRIQYRVSIFCSIFCGVTFRCVAGRVYVLSCVWVAPTGFDRGSDHYESAEAGLTLQSLSGMIGVPRFSLQAAAYLPPTVLLSSCTDLTVPW